MTAPLAERMRPQALDDVLGQQQWIGVDGPIRQMLARKRLHSIVFWGPPGCGKTTIARALAHTTNARFVQISAVLDGVKQLRAVLENATVIRRMEQRDTVLFVDEIHRWNKAQQDALLPHVESGALILIGATTENPSFQLNAALRSRVQIIHLQPLADEDISALLRRALATDPDLSSQTVQLTDEAMARLVQSAAGDARRALTDLERIIESATPGSTLGPDDLARLLARDDLRHDRGGEDHYNVLSALIKSLRGSDPDASIYWLARLIAAGEDALSIARRLVIFASEDVGNADPRALEVAVAGVQAIRVVGMPEGRICLAQTVTWLATCPKSNASYLAIDQALAEVKRTGALPVPLPLRQASTRELREEGYGANYRYPHDFPYRIVRQQYLPDTLQGRKFYIPAGHGDEKRIAERLAWWARKLDDITDRETED
jgi:putative ATPase